MANLDLAAIRERLQEELDQWVVLREHMKQQGAEEGEKDSLQELSMYDNHPGDLGTSMFNRSQDIALRGNLDHTIGLYENALLKMNEGTYGLCEECGRPIDVPRLQAKPEARYCRGCQAIAEERATASPDRASRPVEEELLYPPFSRTFLDHADQMAFDGEDSWQAVARFGSSDTPSDVMDAEQYPDVYEDADEMIGAVQAVEMQVDEEGEPIPDEERRTE